MSDSKEKTCAEAETPQIDKVTSFLMGPILFPSDIAPYENEIQEKLKDPDLLEWVTQVLSKRIVGEDLNKKTMFSVALSYKLHDEPQAVIVTGPPAIGKSWLTKNVLRLFPNVINLSRITAAALDRLDVDLSHYILYISELAGHEQSTPTLRVMLSEGELRLATVEMSQGKLMPKIIETTGRPVYVTTTITEILERQLASRTWLLTVDQSKEQTQRILDFQAKRASSINKDEFDHEEMVLRCLLYRLEPHKVLIPYAEALSALFPSAESQARRDFQRLLVMIKCITLLFQKQRALITTRGEQALLSNLVDLGYALKLIKPILFTTLYALPEKAFEILDVFKKDGTYEFSVKEIAKYVELSQNRTRVIMNGLVDRGFLFKDESSRTHKYSWTQKNLEEPTILSVVISEEFFSEEEFKKWWFSNECSYYTGWSDVYRNFIVPCMPLSSEQLQQNEKNLETMFKPKNNASKSTIEQMVTIPKPMTSQETLVLLRSTWTKGYYTDFDELIMKTKGCSKEEAEQLREKWLDEGIVAYDPEGLLAWSDSHA